MKKIIIVFMILVSILVLTGCGTSSEKNLVKDAQTLAKTVYEATTSQKSEISQKIKQYKLSNDFYYKEFRVYDSFGFNVNLDFSMTPYLENYIMGEDVFVIIALLEFTDSTFEESTMLQKMIIFEYQNQVVGFMSTSISSLDSLNGYNFNCAYLGTENRKINYNFSSCMFLTKDAIVKYYEKNDIIYTFNYNEDTDGNISFSAETGIAWEETTHYDITIQKDSYKVLHKGVVIDLINSCYIEKVEFVAIITGFDKDNRKIFVESDEYPTLESVWYRFAILDSVGIIDIEDLKIGDEIVLYFYRHYSEYKPVNITVDNIYKK